MKKISLDDFVKLSLNDVSGKTIAFITDTVWGIGVRVDENITDGLNKIYKLKKRDLNKPLAVLTSSKEDALKHVEITYSKTSDLIKLWPGALTLIFKKSDDFYDKVTPLDTIGIRVPNSKVALGVLKFLGYVATTSINISGMDELNNIVEIENSFKDYIDYLIIDTHELSKVSSTVLDISKDSIKVIRLGDLKINV